MNKFCFVVTFVNGTSQKFYVNSSKTNVEVVLDMLYDRFEKLKMVKVNDMVTNEPIMLNSNNVLFVSDMSFDEA